ncbi:MAG: hypothetical protein WCK14_05855, partial [Actinomycetota bacterium]
MGSQRIVRELPATEANTAHALAPRNDFVKEEAGTTDAAVHTFTQAEGPFTHYERTVEIDATTVRETTRYRLAIPWFGWLFRSPVRRTIAR